MQYTETVSVKIPNLSRTYHFLHLSDAHVAYALPEESEENKAHAQKQTKRWQCADIPPVELFQTMLAEAQEEELDAILMAGDCIDYYSPGTVAFMQKHLPASKIEVLYAFGNHEGCRYSDGPTFLPHEPYRDLAPVMMGTPDFWVRDFGEFLIVGLDDSTQTVSWEQVEKLKAQIARNMPIILLIHIPLRTIAIEPSVMEMWGTSFMVGTEEDPDSTKAFCNLVTESENVVAVLAGHLHYAHTGEFAPGRMQYVSAPSYTGFLRKVVVEKA